MISATSGLMPKLPVLRSPPSAKLPLMPRVGMLTAASNDLGQAYYDAQNPIAEIAAVGQVGVDAQSPTASGGTFLKNDLGHVLIDALLADAEIVAAVGQTGRDAQCVVADGGIYSRNLGQGDHDIQCSSVEIAAVGLTCHDAPRMIANGGTNTKDA